MFEVPVRKVSGVETGSLTVQKKTLGGCVRNRLLKDVIVAYEAHARVGTASVKTRAMITGSTKKIYRQKGTGRARHGSRKVNIFRGGGVAHGPVPRNYGGRLSRKARRVATASALLSKLRDKEVVLLDKLALDRPSTTEIELLLGNIGIEDETVLVLLPDSGGDEEVRNVYLSCRNLAGVDVRSIREVNARDLLRSRLLVASQATLEKLIQRVGVPGTEGN